MEQPLPLVSIVTPSYNQAPFLRETIESVLAQDYPRVEYIIMDGGSTDGSVDIIRSFADRLAYWTSAPDKGQADAINAGWKRARGEILAYLNSDDTLNPNAVRLSVQALLDEPQAGLSYGACAWINTKSERIGLIESKPFALANMLLQNQLAQPSVFIRRGALERVGMLDESMHYLMDYDLWLRIALHFPFTRAKETLANFRLHDDSKTASQYRYFLNDNLRLLDKAFSDSALPAELASMRPRAENYAYVLTALHCYSLGRSQDGRELMQRYFETQPAPLAYPDDLIALFANHLVHMAPLRERLATSSEVWLDTLFRELPPNALELAHFRSQILAQANIAWGFDAHARGAKTDARKFMLRALEYDPANARNRGVWSVLLKSLKPSAVSMALL